MSKTFTKYIALFILVAISLIPFFNTSPELNYEVKSQVIEFLIVRKEIIQILIS